MHVLKSVTFAYDAREDRILAAINPGRPEAWSVWLTRRLVMALLGRSGEFVASASPVVQRAPPDVRPEVVAMEREAAIAKTIPAMSHTPPEVVKSNLASAELALRVTIAHQGERFRMELRSGAGGGADATLTPAEFQRILQMLQREVAKAGWASAPPAPQPAPGPQEPPAKPVRH